MSPKTNENPRTLHERVRELLPWYVSRSLSEGETLEIEQHLAGCESCRSELAPWSSVAGLVGGQEPEPWSPPAAPYGRTAGAIRSQAARPATPRSRSMHEALRGWLESLQSAPATLRWAALAGLLAIAAVPGVWLGRSLPDADSYRTLTSAPPAIDEAPGPVDPGLEIRIALAPEGPTAALRTLLESQGAQIVSGPTPLGVYTVRAGSVKERDRLLELLRASADVQLAEPVGGELGR